MNKEEFLKQLEQLLSDINPAERQEALQYYRDYFEDANMEEEEVIRELGSVQAVADSIREDLEDKELVLIKENKEQEKAYFEFEEKKEQTQEGNKREMSTGHVVAIVLIAVLFSPVFLSLALGALGAVLGVLGALLGIFVASAACMVAFGVAAVVCLIVAIAKIFTSPVASLILIGACMICLGLCFLSTLLMIKMVTCILPGVFRGIAYVVSLPFRKKEAVAV